MSLTMATLASMIGRLGLDGTIVQFIAFESSVQRWEKVKGIYLKSILMSVIFSSAIAITIFLSAPWLSNFVFQKTEFILPIQIMSLSVTPLSMVYIHAEALKGLKKIGRSQIVYGLLIPLFLVLGIFLRQLNQTVTVTEVAWTYFFSVILASLVGFVLWQQATPQLRLLPGDFPTKRLLHSCLQLIWIAPLN